MILTAYTISCESANSNYPVWRAEIEAVIEPGDEFNNSTLDKWKSYVLSGSEVTFTPISQHFNNGLLYSKFSMGD